MNGISLIMATLGRVAEVQRFVEALCVQTCRDFELIVVDQNPDDRLVPVLAQAQVAGIACKHLRQAEPNQCLARNTGLAAATMDLVAFPDDDCWYEPETLEQVLTRMSKENAPAGLLIRWAEQDSVGGAEHVLDNRKWRAFREVHASMITQFFRRDLFASVGGFDAALGLHSWFGGAEETDLMFRILASGAEIVYSSEPLVHHAYFSGIAKAPLRQACWRARSRSRGTGALYAKHRLNAYVVLRGFLAPLLRPLLHWQGFQMLARGVCTSLGRVEGFLRWSMTR